MSLQAILRFPGLQLVRRFSYTLSHGVMPGVFSVEIAPQANTPQAGGVVQIQFGQTTLQFPGCIVDSASIRRSSSGQVVSLSILDRRWKWRFGEIWGVYNLRATNGAIDDVRSLEKTPQELARLLLQAMGESADVSALPNDTRPEVRWEGDTPATELSSLCDSLGCRVALGLGGTVRIVRLGQGKPLPNNALKRTIDLGIQGSAIPDSLKAVSAPTVWQTKFRLEAVGLDRDGRIRPIQKLKYKPSTGADGVDLDTWSSESPGGFFGVTNKQDRKLALQSVFRWYRIATLADGSHNLPHFAGNVKTINQYLPLQPDLLTRFYGGQKDPLTDLAAPQPIPAYVEGVFFAKGPDYQNLESAVKVDSQGNSVVGTRYPRGFSLDGETGIVKFSDWVCRLTSDGEFQEAELYLTCAHGMTDDKTKLPQREYLQRALPAQKQGTGTRVIQAPDVIPRCINHYDTVTAKKIVTSDFNQQEVQKALTYFLDAAQRSIQFPETAEAEYAGIMPLEPDGAIQQVSWSGGPQGGVTRASLNTEFDLAIPSYQEKQRQLNDLARRGIDPARQAQLWRVVNGRLRFVGGNV